MADFVTDAQGNRVTDVQGNYVTENPTGVQTYHFTNPQAGQHTIFQDTYGVRKIQIKAWNPTGYLVDGLSGEIAPAQNMNSLYITPFSFFLFLSLIRNQMCLTELITSRNRSFSIIKMLNRGAKVRSINDNSSS